MINESLQLLHDYESLWLFGFWFLDWPCSCRLVSIPYQIAKDAGNPYFLNTVWCLAAWLYGTNPVLTWLVFEWLLGYDGIYVKGTLVLFESTGVEAGWQELLAAAVNVAVWIGVSAKARKTRTSQAQALAQAEYEKEQEAEEERERWKAAMREAWQERDESA